MTTSVCFYCLLILTLWSPSTKRKPTLTRERISTWAFLWVNACPFALVLGLFLSLFLPHSFRLLKQCCYFVSSCYSHFFHLLHCSLEMATEENNAFSCFGLRMAAAAAVWMMLWCSLTICWGKHSSKVSCACKAIKLFKRFSGQNHPSCFAPVALYAKLIMSQL